jgi:hypothetical protein
MPGEPKDLSPTFYEIQVAGRLSPEWAAWFEGMQISTLQTTLRGPVTVLQGSIADQAALFGALTRIRDLGLKLISVNRIVPEVKKEGS